MNGKTSMIDNWIVFGGWALRPQILTPLFGPGAVLIDTNEIMPDLVRNNMPTPDWQSILADRVLRQIPAEPYGIGGWSTGSLLAYALAHKTRPACGVFISATPSFCRRPGFQHGWKPAALKAMRGELAADPRKVLTEVYEQCGGNSGDFGPQVPSEHIQERLSAGLFFLEQATLLPVKKLPFPALFLHGKDDTIIPSAAGKYFSDAAGGTFFEHDGPHAFFINQNNIISEFINNYFEISAPCLPERGFCAD
jgi:pimeloyl-ACP methyl ester carboxylesterase